jgi:Tol biopolymer transport system component
MGTWMSDGKRIAFGSSVDGPYNIFWQPADGSGPAERLNFEAPYVPTPVTFPNYDVSPDGQRFLMLKEDEQAQFATQINIVQNWFEELKQRVPTGTK